MRGLGTDALRLRTSYMTCSQYVFVFRRRCSVSIEHAPHEDSDPRGFIDLLVGVTVILNIILNLHLYSLLH